MSEINNNIHNYGYKIDRIDNKKDNADICLIKAQYGSKTEYGRNPREAGIKFG